MITVFVPQRFLYIFCMVADHDRQFRTVAISLTTVLKTHERVTKRATEFQCRTSSGLSHCRYTRYLGRETVRQNGRDSDRRIMRTVVHFVALSRLFCDHGDRRRDAELCKVANLVGRHYYISLIWSHWIYYTYTMAGARPHQIIVTLPWQLFSHSTWVSVFSLIWQNIFQIIDSDVWTCWQYILQIMEDFRCYYCKHKNMKASSTIGSVHTHKKYRQFCRCYNFFCCFKLFLINQLCY